MCNPQYQYYYFPEPKSTDDIKKIYCMRKATELWWENNELHRINGPAVTKWYKPKWRWGKSRLKAQFWYKNGQLHRIGGPAVLHFLLNGNTIEEYWENGTKIH